MLRRLLPLVLGLVLALGLATPVTAQAGARTNAPSVASATSVASQAALIKSEYPGLHFATDADAVALGPALAALNPNGVPPPDPGHEYTVAQFNASKIGKVIGPNAYTYNGEFTITGWVQSGKYWVRTRSAATCPACTLIGAGEATPDGLPNWANPAKWNWKAILGDVWGAIWNSCTKGAISGVTGTATTVVSTNLVATGAKTFIGPYGYALMAVGGCIMNLVNN